MAGPACSEQTDAMSMSEAVDVRDATPADAEGIAGTHIACWQEAYADQLPAELLAGLSATFERRREFWEGIARSSGSLEALLVATAVVEVIGFAHVCPSRDPFADRTTGEVTAIYLRRSYWGRGIGRQLLAEAMNRLRACGFTDATLWVLDTNMRTRRFYEAAGWVVDGTDKTDQIGEVTLREVRYRTSL